MRPKFYTPKMGKKLTNLNRYISVRTDIDETWFVIFDYTTIVFLFIVFVYSNLKLYFLFVFFFFLTFFFFHATLFQIAKRTVLKVLAMEDIRKNFYATEIGWCQVGSVPLNQIELLHCYN